MGLYLISPYNQNQYNRNKNLNQSQSNRDQVDLYSNLVFTGRVSDSKLVDYYSNALCFVFSSLYEGFGIPPMEAQACKCQVVVSDIPSLKEVYGESALYFNHNNVDDIARSIELLLNDENLRENYILKGQKKLKKYSWVKSAIQLKNLVNE